jgi:hypothetical protein
MTVKIQRGRQFLAGDATAQLFDERGTAGTYLSKASEKLVSQQNTVLLRKGTTTVKLSTADEWKNFLTENAGTKQKTDDFAKKFGITFQDFCNVVDDLAVSDDKGLTLNLSPRSNVSKALSLDKHDNDYATKMKADTVLNLTGTGGVKSDAKLVTSPAIGPEILATPIDKVYEHGFYPLQGGFKFQPGDQAFEVFDQWIEIVPTDQVVPVEVSYNPKTGRML